MIASSYTACSLDHSSAPILMSPPLPLCTTSSSVFVLQVLCSPPQVFFKTSILEMDRWLSSFRGLVLPEDLSSFSTIRSGSSQPPVNLAPRNPTLLFWQPWALTDICVNYLDVYVHTHTLTPLFPLHGPLSRKFHDLLPHAHIYIYK